MLQALNMSWGLGRFGFWYCATCPVPIILFYIIIWKCLAPLFGSKGGDKYLYAPRGLGFKT